MKVFIVTDNKWWLKKSKQLFKKAGIETAIYCSPSSNKLFEKELRQKIISTLNIKLNIDYLIENYTLGFSIHCKQIFPSKLVKNIRCINIHPGLNPFNRGWYPQVFSILNKKPAGATIHLMDAEIDHGDILAQAEVEIKEWDTSKTVYDRVLRLELFLFIENFNKIINKSINQKTPEFEGNYNSIQDFENLKLIDLDQTLTMREAIDFFRAMTHDPYKNAFFISKENKRVFVTINLEIE